MNQLLLEFEQHVGLGPVNTSRLLGYAYVTYSQWRSGRRPLQDYSRNHIHDMMSLSEEKLNAAIKDRVYGKR